MQWFQPVVSGSGNAPEIPGQYDGCYYMPLQWHHNGCDSVSDHQPHDCLLNRLFWRRSKKTPKLRVTGFCAGSSPVTGVFPAQRASNAENASIWWRQHALPDHQQAWYWQCNIGTKLTLMGDTLRYFYHFSVEEWYKINIQSNIWRLWCQKQASQARIRQLLILAWDYCFWCLSPQFFNCSANKTKSIFVKNIVTPCYIVTSISFIRNNGYQCFDELLIFLTLYLLP